MCHRWWRRGERAPGTRQIGYQWAYIFSAVRPDTGDDVTLVMPSVNAKVMDLFLAHFATLDQDAHAVMMCDGAGWHDERALTVPSPWRCCRLTVPKNPVDNKPNAKKISPLMRQERGVAAIRNASACRATRRMICRVSGRSCAMGPVSLWCTMSPRNRQTPAAACFASVKRWGGYCRKTPSRKRWSRSPIFPTRTNSMTAAIARRGN